MNVRRARYHLASKFDDWYKSLEDDEVKHLVAKNTIITGGSICSLLSNEKVKDYDLYFTDLKTVQAVAEYYVKIFNENNQRKQPAKVKVEDGRVRIRVKSVGITSARSDDDDYQYFENTNDESADEYVEESVGEILAEADELDSNLLETYQYIEPVKTYQPVFLSDNAITLSGKIQVVVRFYGTPEQIHSNFDYVHCTNYWLSSNRQLYTNHEAMKSALTKDLRYIGSMYPLSSVVRLRRLLRKGWFANAGQILKMCMQISELDLNDIKVLEEQLTGVDTAYFVEMIDVLKNDVKAGKEIDSTYICSIVDRIF